MANETNKTFVLPTIDNPLATCCGGGKPPAPCDCSGAEEKGKQERLQIMEQPFVEGTVASENGPVSRISPDLDWTDRWGTIKARWGVGRMNYRVVPGLYALGNPGEESRVLVTSNYKMSFDKLRHSLSGRNVWIMVLDTDGVNVWCAAGKGTFGTDELIRRISSTGLAKVVSHKKLILPQLGAPGVAAHRVKKESGFKVIYGPILSKDIPAFLDAGEKATPEMRQKRFPLVERAVLIPVELLPAFKGSLMISIAFFLLSGFKAGGSYWINATNYGLFSVASIFCALTAGVILTPLLLPWLPGKAFSLKGMLSGVLVMGALTLSKTDYLESFSGKMVILAWFFMAPAISAYLAMNFTGASTYTSLSGVRKEMRWAVPMQIGAGAVGLCLWVGSLVV
jgi:acetyl-CoA decarbonylase/synthase complex subunit gamma